MAEQILAKLTHLNILVCAGYLTGISAARLANQFNYRLGHGEIHHSGTDEWKSQVRPPITKRQVAVQTQRSFGQILDKDVSVENKLRATTVLLRIQLLFALLACGNLVGCYAPLRSPAIAATALPDSYRTPYRSVGTPLNFAELTQPTPPDYLLGPKDVLQIAIPELYPSAEYRPLEVEVMANGQVQLPLVPAVHVSGMNLQQAQQAITKAYADNEVLQKPAVNVSLAAKSTVEILVLGEVNSPGIYPLPRYQNDVGHALAAAVGLTKTAADMIEVHRKSAVSVGIDGTEFEPGVTLIQDGDGTAYQETLTNTCGEQQSVLKIPLRGLEPGTLSFGDITLNAGDVVRIPSRRHEVFWVVGKLNQTNLVRFTLGDRERELGAGLVIPPDRDIDVVTAVVMAGYIDPIDSPTTVTVQRANPDGQGPPLLIHVDLIRARYDQRETVLVQPGDIIYVNPDPAWWFRRTFDRVVPDLITLPYAQSVLKWFGR
ncbi:MAG: polysaccharide biosynthesis/export family protein [Pirellulaceae bacterium]